MRLVSVFEKRSKRAILFTVAMIAVIGCSSAGVQTKGTSAVPVHTYPEGQCHACHRGSGELEGTETLLAHGKELCYRCHAFKTGKEFVHRAIDVWGCIICHNPHGNSGYPSLLRDPVPELCFGCHDSKDLSQNAHGDLTQPCTFCHDPHMADNKFLLKPAHAGNPSLQEASNPSVRGIAVLG